MNKRGQILNHVIIEIIIVALVLAAFLMVTADKVNARGVRQQVVEGELVLLIESAVPGMSFSVNKININGIIDDIEIKNGKIYASVAGLRSVEGHSFFSKYNVGVEELEDKFVIFVK